MMLRRLENLTFLGFASGERTHPDILLFTQKIKENKILKEGINYWFRIHYEDSTPCLRTRVEFEDSFINKNGGADECKHLIEEKLALLCIETAFQI